jgi:hypothetical protein
MNRLSGTQTPAHGNPPIVLEHMNQPRVLLPVAARAEALKLPRRRTRARWSEPPHCLLP